MLFRITAFACLGGFLYGYDLGLISGALTPIRERFHPSEGVTELVVSAVKLAAIFGTFLGGAGMLYYGRRLTIGLDSIFFIAGPLVMAFANHVAWLVIGRLLIGLGIGVSAVAVPAYLSEVAPAGVRGRLVVCYELLLCLGMLSAMLVDAALMHVRWNWRWMVGAPLIPGIVLAFSLVVLPESPRWLVVQGRLDEALAVIHRLYTNSHLPAGVRNSTAEVEQELLQLWDSVEKEKEATRQRRALARGFVVSRKTRKTTSAGKGRAAEQNGLVNGHHDSSAADGTLNPKAAGATAQIVMKGGKVLELDDDLGPHDRGLMDEAGQGPQSGDKAVARAEAGEEGQLDAEPPAGFWRTFGAMLLDIYVVARGPERHALWIALTLGLVSQAIASTAIINYAPQLLEQTGLKSNSVSTLLSAIVPAAKVVGVLVGIALVDIAGRRPLLIWGSAGCAASMVLLFAADMLHSIPFEVIAMCTFIASFSSSFAGIFWVIVGELFSMSAKSPAASASTAMLFLAGFAADQLFLTMLNGLSSYCFLIFAGLAAFGGVYSYFKVPETKQRTLAEIQAMVVGKMNAPVPLVYGGGGSGGKAEPAVAEVEILQAPTPAYQESSLLPSGAVRSDEAGSLDRSAASPRHDSQ